MSLTVCLTTVSQPPSKPILHTARSSASSFNVQFPLFPLRSSSSCLHLPRLTVTLSLYFSFNLFQKAVPTPDVTNPFSLPAVYCTQYIPLLLGSRQHFVISHTIGPTDLLNPSPAPYFKTSKVFPI